MLRNYLSFHKKSIRARLLLSFILISILPIMLVGFLPYQKSEEVVRSLVLEYAQSTVNQLNENINYQLKEMDLISRVVYYQIYSTFEKEKIADNNTALNNLNLNASNFESFLKALKNNRPFIDDIHVIIGGDSYTTAVDLKKDVLESKEWYTNSLRQPGEKVWVDPHQNDYAIDMPNTGEVISLIYPFRLPNSNTTAVILIEMNRNKLDVLFNRPNILSLGSIFVIDKYGHIIYSTDQKLINVSDKNNQQYITNTDLTKALNTDNFIYDINFFSGWKVAAVVPDNKIAQSFDSVRKTVLILLLAFLVISISIGWTLSNRLLKPLQKLQMDMRQVERGHFHIRSDINSIDEIGDLAKSFNQMIGKIDELIEQISENERKKKKIEMQALQYQINPHFLYNTLNSVQWMAKIHRIPNINEMLTVLIQLLRASLNSKSHLHTLEEELEILSYYIEIQKYRFTDNFQIYYEIEQDLLNAHVPRFILQPLVENSFFHAFSDGKGSINISASLSHNVIVIKVEDDGRGISQETVREIFESTKRAKNSSGIGLNNVDEKIKVYFGSEFGLSVFSEKGCGTTVYIKLPYYLDNKEGDSNVKGLIG